MGPEYKEPTFAKCNQKEASRWLTTDTEPVLSPCTGAASGRTKESKCPLSASSRVSSLAGNEASIAMSVLDGTAVARAKARRSDLESGKQR